jgi:uncharacterized protein (TIGR00725 family)
MKKIIGVMGPGEKQASPQDLQTAFEVGAVIAKLQAVTLTGGMSGVMAEAARGAQQSGGLTMGLGPTDNKADQNTYIDLPLVTAMGPARNYMNVVSSDALVFVSVASAGTLSELAFAIQKEKPSIVIGASQKLQDYVEELGAPNVYFTENIEAVTAFLKPLCTI